jgi:hypothetical protein
VFGIGVDQGQRVAGLLRSHDGLFAAFLMLKPDKAERDELRLA